MRVSHVKLGRAGELGARLARELCDRRARVRRGDWSAVRGFEYLELTWSCDRGWGALPMHLSWSGAEVGVGGAPLTVDLDTRTATLETPWGSCSFEVEERVARALKSAMRFGDIYTVGEVPAAWITKEGDIYTEIPGWHVPPLERVVWLRRLEAVEEPLLAVGVYAKWREDLLVRGYSFGEWGAELRVRLRYRPLKRALPLLKRAKRLKRMGKGEEAGELTKIGLKLMRSEWSSAVESLVEAVEEWGREYGSVIIASTSKSIVKELARRVEASNIALAVAAARGWLCPCCSLPGVRVGEEEYECPTCRVGWALKPCTALRAAILALEDAELGAGAIVEYVRARWRKRK